MGMERPGYSRLSMSQGSRRSDRRRVLSTARGSKLGPFGLVEWALLSGVALLWGSAFLLIEIGLESLAPATITWGRITLGFLVLAAFPVARRPIERSDYPRVVLLGITWVGVPFLLFPIAQQHIDSALAGMLNGMVPIFSASIAIVLMRSIPRMPQTVGIALGVSGAISISLPVVRESAAGTWGVLLIVMANLLYGVSHNLVVPLQQRYGAPAVMMRAIGVAAVATAPFGLAGLTDSQWSIVPVIAVVMMGVIHTGAAFVLMTALVGRVGATRGGVAIYFIPIVAMVLGVVFRSEVVLPLQWTGTAVVLLGAWLTSRRED
jgi:drug/metabolite transporter (DMT)-like permease